MRVIVCGQPRGGTSMVAGVLRILGVHMGERFVEPEHAGTLGAHEDRDLINKPIGDIIKTAKEKDEKYSLWGWKDPFIISRLHQLNRHLKDSKFVYIIRDPIASSLSRKKRQNMNDDEGLMALSFCENNIFLLMEYKNNKENSKIFSYEKALINPKQFVLDLSKFLGIEPSKETIEKAVNFIKPGYRTLDGSQEY